MCMNHRIVIMIEWTPGLNRPVWSSCQYSDAVMDADPDPLAFNQPWLQYLDLEWLQLLSSPLLSETYNLVFSIEDYYRATNPGPFNFLIF